MMNLVPFYILLSFVVVALGSQRPFAVNDDIFAYPQYAISIESTYVQDSEAKDLVQQSVVQVSEATSEGPGLNDGSQTPSTHTERYERIVMKGRSYLCSIPRIELSTEPTEQSATKEDEEKELIRAADRGWELLKDMEGKQCLYYSTSWWSYAFCYNSHVKQFHALQAGAGGARVWPPREDPQVPSYFLGRYDSNTAKQTSNGLETSRGISEVETKTETSYLVQRLQAGTSCDLTGENRRIEIQFHCHPQSTDHIGWVKEIATCAYLMVVYTPRLCNDIAFQPPKSSQAHTISCQQILSEDEVASLQAVRQTEAITEGESNQKILLGNVEIGARLLVGKEGRKIEKGRIVMTVEEKADIIMMQKDGEIHTLSKAQLKKRNVTPEALEAFKEEMQKFAKGKDWKIELRDDGGQMELKGIVSEDVKVENQDPKEPKEADPGSEEEYKQDGDD